MSSLKLKFFRLNVVKQSKPKKTTELRQSFDKGSSINDVKRRGQGFCDGILRHSNKSVKKGGRVKNYPKLRDVIYGQPVINFG